MHRYLNRSSLKIFFDEKMFKVDAHFNHSMLFTWFFDFRIKHPVDFYGFGCHDLLLEMFFLQARRKGECWCLLQGPQIPCLVMSQGKGNYVRTQYDILWDILVFCPLNINALKSTIKKHRLWFPRILWLTAFWDCVAVGIENKGIYKEQFNSFDIIYEFN